MTNAAEYIQRYEDFHSIDELCVRHNIPVPEQVASILELPALSAIDYAEFLSKYEKIRRFSYKFDCMALNGVITIDCIFSITTLIHYLRYTKPFDDFICPNIAFSAYSNPSKQVTDVYQQAFNQLITNTNVLHDYVNMWCSKWGEYRHAVEDFIDSIVLHRDEHGYIATRYLLESIAKDFTTQTAEICLEPQIA